MTKRNKIIAQIDLRLTSETYLSIFLIFWKTAAEDNDGISELEKFVLEESECCIIFSQDQQVSTFTEN